jgi:hexosaminidase
MNKPLLLIFLTFSSLSLLFGQNNTPHLIPHPSSLIPTEGAFGWNEKTKLLFEPENATTSPVIRHILNDYHIGFGHQRQYESSKYDEANTVSFLIDPMMEHEEGYTLSVDENAILCRAKTPTGWFYAWQTLKQLLPQTFFDSGNPVELPFTIPGVEIVDHPRFAYRGMHLDVCRHFFTVEEVKKYIDLLAMHKMNRFHWHLTEDQGWRIEIKKYPRLTEVGAWRKETLIGHYNDQPHRFDDQVYGGFYTQEEIREVVRYAEQRQVTIVPEIEMPGHALAMLAAYPELACSPGPFEVATKWGVFEDVLCPTETTFAFLADVLWEVAELFPGEYIHIGGDEVPKTRWKESTYCQQLIREKGLADESGLQSYFIRRIEKILQGYGKKLIGWDEILEGGLSPGATVMSWRGTHGGIEAARMGHDVIMTPGSHCYFDHYQSDHPDEPLAIGGFTPLEKVYAYEPIPVELSAREAGYILGAQANLWTEYIRDFDQVEYMAYPRACALAEVLWSPRGTRDLDRFSNHLHEHLKRLGHLDVNYAPHLLDVSMEVECRTGDGIFLTMKKKLDGGEIRYTALESLDLQESLIYKEPVRIRQSGTWRAAWFLDGDHPGRVNSVRIDLHKATAAGIELVHPPDERYNSGGVHALVNGVSGSDQRYGDKEWLGFSGKDMIARLDLGKEVSINRFKTRFFNAPGQWIYTPTEVAVYGGNDPGQLELIKAVPVDPGQQLMAVPFEMDFPSSDVRYISIKVRNYGTIPEGRQGGGHPAWLFVDELLFE